MALPVEVVCFGKEGVWHRVSDEAGGFPCNMF